MAMERYSFTVTPFLADTFDHTAHMKHALRMMGHTPSRREDIRKVMMLEKIEYLTPIHRDEPRARVWYKLVTAEPIFDPMDVEPSPPEFVPPVAPEMLRAARAEAREPGEFDWDGEDDEINRSTGDYRARV